MEQQPAMSWPGQLHENLIPASNEDEFSNFLEFNMHFPDLEGHGPAAHSQLHEQQAMVNPPTSSAPATAPSDLRSHLYTAPMEGLAMDFSGGPGPVQSHVGPMPYSTPNMTPGFCAQDSSQQSQSQSRWEVEDAILYPAQNPYRSPCRCCPILSSRLEPL